MDINNYNIEEKIGPKAPTGLNDSMELLVLLKVY